MRNGTIAYYDGHAKEFVSRTLHADMRETQERFLEAVGSGGRILDFGCGSGRDSQYFAERGYNVTAIDGSEELCRIASAYTGLHVCCMDFFDFEADSEYDGIWACASLLHVERENLGKLLGMLERAMKAGGVLYISFKEGEFSGMRGGRYFADMTQESMRTLVLSATELREISTWRTVDVREDHAGENWVNGLFRKIRRSHGTV